MEPKKNLHVEAEQKNQQKKEKRYMLSYTLFEGEKKTPRWVRSPFNNQEEVKKHISYIVTQELCGKDSFKNLEIISEDDLDNKIEDTLSLREYKFGKTYQNLADRKYEEKLKVHNSIKEVSLWEYMKKILSYEEFYNSPRLFVLSDSEIKSDYKKLEIQYQYKSLKRKYNFNFKRKKFDVANSIKEEIDKLIGIKE